MRLLAALLLLGPLSAADIGRRADELIASSPAANSAFWGIRIVDLSSGKVVYDRSGGRFFVPASNTKLFTTALALDRLGRDYRFTTTVAAASPPDDSGVISGPLVLVGGGDPNLSPRVLPYRKDSPPGNPLAAIEDLAAQVTARGVRRVLGDVIGDDTLYPWEPFPPGWGVDDNVWDYGAPVSALVVNDGVLNLMVAPGERDGNLAHISLSPPLEYYEVDNRVRTTAGGERKIHVDRVPGSRQLRLWGAMPAGSAPRTEPLGMDDPALYAACALRDALLRRGVAVDGIARARHRYPSQREAPPAFPVELARRTSAPLLEDLRVTDKVSLNLHAEMTLRAVARVRTGEGSREAGIEELTAFLDEAGVPHDSYNLNDGSGLTRLNLVTAVAVTGLLRYMYASPVREDWISLLPVGGVDGTLAKRFVGTPAAGRIHAKTGSLSHVSALSGYAERKDGGMLAFSILVNNFSGTGAEIRLVMDRICNLMVE